MTMKRLLFSCLSLLFVLSGCAGITTQFVSLQEPQSGDRARLRVIANHLVKAVPGKDCIDWSAPGAGTVFGGIVGSKGFRGRSLDMPAGLNQADRNSTAEMYVAANQPFTLVLLTTLEAPVQCSVAVSFTPEADRDYEAVARLTRAVCSISVTQIGEGSAPVSVEKADRCK